MGTLGDRIYAAREELGRDTSIGSQSDSACNRLSILLNELERTGHLSAGQVSSVDRESMHDNYAERIKSIERDLP